MVFLKNYLLGSKIFGRFPVQYNDVQYPFISGGNYASCLGGKYVFRLPTIIEKTCFVISTEVLRSLAKQDGAEKSIEKEHFRFARVWK
ncbi:MAG: hypothetical protein ABFD79_01805 [Phycisphaerales bacterium]